MGNIQSRAVLGALVVAVATSACPTEPRDPGGRPVDCIVDDDPDGPSVVTQAAEALARIGPMAIELFLEDDSGGPLRCRPSVEDCLALGDCAGAPVQVPIGTQATLAVGVRPVPGEPPVRAVFTSAVFADSSDPAFSLLAPLPTSIEFGEDAVFFLVSVTPTTEGVISAEVILGTDARNVPLDTQQVSITLRVEGVQP